MLNGTYQRKWILATCLFLSVVGMEVAAAQAKPSAERGSELDLFGQVLYLRPGYGSASSNTYGYAAGLDFTPIMFRKFQPSVELRATEAGPAVQTEYSYSGGLKVATTVGSRLHPYATLLRGLGFVYFQHPGVYSGIVYTHDSSRMFSVGGGADFELSRQWQVSADFSQQYWALENYTVRPTAVSVGIAYRIPFR